MRKRRAKALLAFFVSLILFCGCAFFMVRAAEENGGRNRAFQRQQSAAAQAYENKEELAALAPQTYEAYLERDMGVVAATQSETFRLHTTLRYYAHPGDVIPVLVQEAGTEVQTFPLRITGPNAKGELYVHYEMPAAAYAFWYSLPTSQRGWRCTRALQTAITAVDAKDQKQTEQSFPLYYVRTNDLLKEAQVYREQSLPQFLKADVRDEKWQDFSYSVFYGLDYAFLKNGVTVSPNLLEPIWSTWSIILCGLGAVFLILSIVWIPKGKAQWQQYRRELQDGPILEDSKEKVWGLSGFPRGKR